jgi:polysaccharide biosynthesis transport protein
MELLKLWAIIVRRKKIFIVVILTTVLVPLVGSFMVKPVYKCRAKVWIKYKSQTPQLVLPALSADYGKFSYSTSDYLADTFVSLIESRPVISSVIHDLELKDRKGQYYDVNSFVEPGFVRKALTQKEGVEAVQINDSELFEIKAYSTDVEKAAKIANKVAEEFLTLFYNVNNSDAASSQKVLEQEVARVRGDWDAAEKQKMEFRTNKLALDLDKQKSSILNSTTSLQDQKTGNDVTIAADRATLSFIEASLKEQPEYKPSDFSVENLSSLSTYKTNLLSLELSLADKLTQYTEFHPSVRALQAQIEYTKKAMKSIITQSMSSESILHTTYFDNLIQKYGDAMVEISALTAKNSAIEQQVHRLERDQRALVSVEQEYTKIAQTSDNLKTVLQGLIQQLEYVKIAQSIKVTNATIAENAVAPEQSNIKNYKYFPNRTYLLFIALFLGTLLGFCVVLFLEYIDDTFKSRSEIEQHLKLPVLVTLPDWTTLSTRGMNEPK